MRETVKVVMREIVNRRIKSFFLHIKQRNAGLKQPLRSMDFFPIDHDEIFKP